MQRRKVGGQVGRNDLEYTLWARQILEVVLAEVTQLNPTGQRVTHQLLRRVREKYLTAMASRTQTRGPIERWAEVVVIALLGRTNVDRRAYCNRAGRPPYLATE